MATRRLLGALLTSAVVLAALLVGLRPTGDGPTGTGPSTTGPTTGPTVTGPVVPTSAASDDHINRILVISLDGLNPTALRKLGSTGTPALHRVMREGPRTLNARTAYERTETLPNHTGMMTGRRIRVALGGHGVSFNDDDARTTVHRAAGEYVASAFDVVHDRGGRTWLYTSKSKFALYNRTWSANGRADRVGVDNGRDKISRFVYDQDETRLTSSLVRAVTSATKPRYAFLHLAGPDRAGHAYGFMSQRYLDAVRATDARVGRVMAAIRGNAELRDHMAVIITADHGGLGASHGDPTLAADYTIPFLAWGKGMAAGADLYALNPAYADPGAGRPTYGAAEQPVRNMAAANLAMDLLDHPAVPGAQFDNRMNLRVFR
ncbi:alkaline phosphatase family protein [Nocardioides sp.]|uniref:alkaline phosphatase family protein n=1 Tax=Nocardioides sp. TaxID=35761 RepID=UPI002B9E0E25|nr:alkaline phosphatase family protein [Nocardioides sp.]HSX69186.1 alkaline phosphatase family protein [Nocardioides sp.]